MSAPRAERLRRLYHEALPLPPATRTAFLEDACPDDLDLRLEAASLLAVEAESGGFMALPLARLLPAGVDPTPDWQGKLVGPYRVGELIGLGGMGVVYAATDTRLERPVALKFLAELPTDGWARARFLREARAAAALDHPSIGTVFDIGEWEGHPYIAMALLEGETLDQRIRGGPLSFDATRAILEKLAEGLLAAHRAGVIHRDLKPRNIFLTDAGGVKIIDFGLAKRLDASDPAGLSLAGVALGTADYMSPEQARGEPVDHRTDLWSLGVVAYEMLTGVRPFAADGVGATLARVLSDEPAAVATVRPDVPTPLGDIVRLLLQKRREDRPASADAVLALLQGTASPMEDSGARPGEPSDDADGGPGEAAFAPGDLVAGRFQIERFIARGGMGEVYAASDLLVGGRVALKSITPELARDAAALARLRRELRLSRHITHPNVSRLFDLGQDRRPGRDGTIEVRYFLTLELLEGETLAERIRRRGRMPLAEAVPILSQMAEALGAAHDAGVIHRDLKPDNVFLLPAERRPGGVRVVVTDFGLAASHAAEDISSSSGRGRSFTGTLCYMSPEQVRARELTTGSDVYAFGLVAFEMLTGRRPFEAESPMAEALDRLRRRAPEARFVVPDLDPVWSAAIARALHPNPRRRPRRAKELLPGWRDARSRRRTWSAPLLMLLALLGIAAAWWLRDGTAPATPAAGPSYPRVRKVVAVPRFRDLSADSSNAWLSTALAEMLSSELAISDGLRAVPGEVVARALQEMGSSGIEVPSPEALAALRSRLGSDVLVLGSFTALHDQVRLDLRLVETGGIPDGALVIRGEAIFDLVARAGGELRRQLGVPPATEEERLALKAKLPDDPEAHRLYAEGLERLRGFDLAGAVARLEAAVEADPDHASAHGALSEALARLGYEERARAEARIAYELSGSLSRQERLVAEGRHQELELRWDEAIATYEALFRFYPDDLEHGLRLAAAQARARRLSDAESTIEKLRLLPTPACEDPRIDLALFMESDFAYDPQQDLDVSTRALQSAERLGATHAVAEAQRFRSSALMMLSRPEEAAESLASCREASLALGDLAISGACLCLEARLYAAQGKFEASEAKIEEARRMARTIGSPRLEATAHHARATVRTRLGDAEAALAAFDEARRLFRESGGRAGEFDVRLERAYTLAYLGRYEGLREEYASLLDTSRQWRDRLREIDAMRAIGELELRLGDALSAERWLGEAYVLAREANPFYRSWLSRELGKTMLAREHPGAALRALRDSAAMAREMRNPLQEAIALYDVGALHLHRGEIDDADSTYRRAFDLASAGCMQYVETVALAGSAQAALLLAEDERAVETAREALRRAPPLAEDLARTTLAWTVVDVDPVEAERLARKGAPSPDSRLALARSLALQGRHNAAREALDEARRLAGDSSSVDLRARIAIHGGRVALASGDPALVRRAREELRDVARRCAAIGYRGWELQARLVLAEIGADPERSPEALARLAEEAASLSCRLVALGATELARGGDHSGRAFRISRVDPSISRHPSQEGRSP